MLSASNPKGSSVTSLGATGMEGWRTCPLGHVHWDQAGWQPVGSSVVTASSWRCHMVLQDDADALN